jgi:hypothetical protein
MEIEYDIIKISRKSKRETYKINILEWNGIDYKLSESIDGFMSFEEAQDYIEKYIKDIHEIGHD